MFAPNEPAQCRYTVRRGGASTLEFKLQRAFENGSVDYVNSRRFIDVTPMEGLIGNHDQ